MAQNHALVVGASGLIGWGIVNELLSEDSIAKSEFHRVTALMNRPIRKEETLWPDRHPSQPELLMVDGVNLMNKREDITGFLQRKIPDADTITHAFYFVFKQDDDAETEVQVNKSMLTRLTTAVESLTKNLKFVVFPGGTRGYGIYQPGGIFTAPLEESLVDNLPEAYAKTVAYPTFRKVLTKASRDKGWTWAEVCPDAVIGFAPNGSGWSLAAHWAVYLFLWRQVHGADAEIHYPGTVKAYDSLYTEASTRTLARVVIHASLRPDTCGGGRLFNVADNDAAANMRTRWPQIVSWFGLRGVPPPPEGYRGDKPGDFIRKHKHLLAEAGVKGAETWNSEQLDSYGYWLDFDRHLSLGRLRDEAGFVEQSKPEEGWWRAFGLFLKAGMISRSD